MAERMAVDAERISSMTRSQQARRDRVIEAALQLAEEGGYDAVQMRDVASTASVALGTIYRYFASKDHLLAAALVEWSSDLKRRLAVRPPRGDTPAERVVDVVSRAHRSMERHPQLAAALITAVTSPDPAIVEYQREMMAILGEVLSLPMEGVDEQLRDAVLRVLTHVWFATLLGWVNGWNDQSEVAEELEVAARLLLRDA